MKTKVKFLTSPEVYAITLPDTVDPVPDMSGVITLDGGAREVVFQPYSRNAEPAAAGDVYSHQFDATIGGISVSVYLRRQAPSYFAAFWRLRNGILNTFMDDPSDCNDDSKTALTGIETILGSMRVAEDPSGLPRLTLKAPLSGRDLRDPIQRDLTTFVGGRAPWPVVRLYKESPWAREGKQKTDLGQVSEIAVTTPLQVTVACQLPSSEAAGGEAIASELASSLALS